MSYSSGQKVYLCVGNGITGKNVMNPFPILVLAMLWKEGLVYNEVEVALKMVKIKKGRSKSPSFYSAFLASSILVSISVTISCTLSEPPAAWKRMKPSLSMTTFVGMPCTP